MPVGVFGITDATAITAGDEHSCALHEDSTISCWGNDDDGRLGDGADTNFWVPVGVFGITDATAITAGERHSCALHQIGTVSCWGNNNSGQLGNRTGARSSVPMEVVGITDATAITAGRSHSCALHQDGTISCWGTNWNGELGNGTDTNSLVPVQVQGITDATAITAGGRHSCALHQDGTISCWGRNRDGQLGSRQSTGDWEDDNTDSLVPVQVEGITDATAITTGHSHSCALREGGTISCWGANFRGQLGNGTNTSSSVPVLVERIADATAITAGHSHSCALHEGGTISCWGANNYGQLGNGQSTGDGEDDSADSLMPVQVEGITDATAITTGHSHSCALREGGTISCWGDNNSGQLGNGTDAEFAEFLIPEEFMAIPVEVTGIADATAITAGRERSCVLRQTGTISCWGNNIWGQLGNGAWLPQFIVGFGV